MEDEKEEDGYKAPKKLICFVGFAVLKDTTDIMDLRQIMACEGDSMNKKLPINVQYKKQHFDGLFTHT